ncbi:MAG: LysR family transcriptional regulator [Sphaerochaeta associata]|uniref:LysR family transcriptional regulator n=1 Tax=Sphaerochaeta associata TaxID=1129264 RepID=UPI002B1EF1FB|nr:LysR family transcriptional regulator [Sphaerochaeta associata]MEA5028682.1 LysR family transcriptional regulator [Sphaerochaeta associata]
MNTKQFLYVQVLSHEGSFSRAADTLSITQPSLSQYIKKIEKQIGLTLFDRTNGDVRLTDAGKVYIETGRKILDLEHQMENSFTDLSAYKSGSLIIGAAPYRAASMLPTIARSFQALHPGMHLVVREGTTAELVEGMEHGEYDLALTLLPIDNRLFAWEKVMEEELVLAVQHDYPPISVATIPERKFAAIDVKELDGKSLVMLTDAQYMQKQLANLMIDHKINVHIAAIVKSLEAQIEFVKAGVGMALVPSGIERFCNDRSVVFYSFNQPLPKREVVVMWRKDRKLSATAEELKNVIHSIEW